MARKKVLIIIVIVVVGFGLFRRVAHARRLQSGAATAHQRLAQSLQYNADRCFPGCCCRHGRLLDPEELQDHRKRA